MKNLKVLKTQMGQIYVGKVTQNPDHVIVETPYTFVFAPEGLLLIPLDYEIVGKKVPQIQIDNRDVLYIIDPDEKISQYYTEKETGIVIPGETIVT